MLLLFFSGLSVAADFDPGGDEVDPLHTPLLADTLFGDHFDTRSGTGTFSLFDIDLPGNSALPVRLKHLEAFTHANSNRAQAGPSAFPSPRQQKFEFPAVYGIVPGDNTRTLCSTPIPTELARKAGFGPTAIIDGVESPLFRIDSHAEYPANTSFVSKDHWLINCITDADGYEGFQITTTAGLIYTFDIADIHINDNYSHLVTGFMLYPSKITDRFGNWVSYDWGYRREGLSTVQTGKMPRTETSLNLDYQHVLLSISANDGRKISLSGADDVTVTAAGRTWQYHYQTATQGADSNIARSNQREVVLPDNSRFIVYEEENRGVSPLTYAFVIEHPQGAVARYDMREYASCGSRVWAASNRVPVYDDPWADSACYAPFPASFPVADPSKSYVIALKKDSIEAVTRKTLTLSNGSTHILDIAITDGFETTDDQSKTDVNNTLRTVTFTSQDKIHRYSHYQIWDHRQALLKREQITDRKSAVVLQQIDYDYETVDAPGYACLFAGCLDAVERYNRINWDKIQLKSRLKKITTTIGSDKYYNEALQSNIYDAVTERKEWNNFNHKVRYSRYGFRHDKTNWVLNQSTTVALSGDGSNYTTVNETTYHSATLGEADYADLPYQSKTFGQWTRRIASYHADGNAHQIEFNALLKNAAGADTAKQRYQTLSNYKAGQAQTLVQSARYNDADTMTQTQLVNDFAQPVSVTDFDGNTTVYSYDALSRLKTIDPANSFWLDTLHTWSEVGNQPQLVKSQCTLNATKEACVSGTLRHTQTLTFDSKLRAVKVVNKDHLLDISVFEKFNYNDAGRVTFAAYAADDDSQTDGISSSYDGLQRIHTISQSGGGTQTSTYLAGNKRKVNDFNGIDTTTTYLAYGAPDYRQPSHIASPESVTTTLAIDLFGDINAITQSGPNKAGTGTISQTQYNVYDSNRQLCKVVRKDVGQSYYSYSVLGELLARAEGVTGGTTSDCTATVSAEQTISYNLDNLGNRRTVTYGDSSPTVSYTLSHQGDLTELTAGAVSQSYHYNDRHLLKDESLTVDGKTFALTYGYDNMGFTSSLQYPNQDMVNYAPNAFGQATKATRSGQNYVTAADYYPNGRIKNFTYGNGIVRHVTLNSRQLPNNITDAKPEGVTAFKQSYTYDNNQNLKSIIDGINNSFNLDTLSYDGLNRLTGATGVTAGYGNSAIDYDGLGNITRYSSKGHNLDYTYNTAINRLTSVTDSVGSTSFTGAYDDRANVTNNGKRSFTFNRANQLIASGSNRYVYDGHSRRVKVSDSKGTSYSVYSRSGQMLYRELNGNGVMHIYFDKHIVAKDGIMPVNANGNSQQHHRPYGEPIEPPKDDIGYAGHKFDTDLGLSYMQQRYYDPSIGRFISNDPLGFRGVHSFNRYAYANNNPYKFVDPDGRNAVIKLLRRTYHHNGNVVEAAYDVSGELITVFAPSSTPFERIESAISLVSPVDLNDVKKFKAMLETVKKKYGGRKGNALTRALNMAIQKTIKDKGGNTSDGFNRGREKRHTNGGKGKGSSRYSDGTAVDENGNAFEVQTVDTKADGTMTTRETEAAADIADMSKSPVVCYMKSCDN